jgi:hypothetical protein
MIRIPFSTWVLDPDQDPTWVAKGSASDTESDPTLNVHIFTIQQILFKDLVMEF